MDFRFDRDDQAMIAGIAEVFQHGFPVSRLREREPAIAPWAEAGGGGWLHAGLAEEHGGLGVQPHLVCAFAREAGRSLVVDAWTNNAVIIPRLIAALADRQERDRWLARHREHPGFIVVDGRHADLRAGDPCRADWCYGVEPGWDAYAVDRAGARVVRTSGSEVSLQAIGGNAPGVGAVALEGGERAEASLGSASLDAIAREAALVHSAALVGLAERAAALTVEYAKLREQFGRPIGQFQVPKHMLADVHVLNEVAWNACLYAALRGDAEPASHDASRVQAAEAAMAATRTMLQLHGGFGFTWESDVHLFLKTALTGALRFGSREEHARSLGEALVAA